MQLPHWAGPGNHPWQSVERRSDDIAKSGDDQQAEDPAEEQEQAAARRADVLFDEDAH